MNTTMNRISLNLPAEDLKAVRDAVQVLQEWTSLRWSGTFRRWTTS